MPELVIQFIDRALLRGNAQVVTCPQARLTGKDYDKFAVAHPAKIAVSAANGTAAWEGPLCDNRATCPVKTRCNHGGRDYDIIAEMLGTLAPDQTTSRGQALIRRS